MPEVEVKKISLKTMKAMVKRKACELFAARVCPKMSEEKVNAKF